MSEELFGFGPAEKESKANTLKFLECIKAYMEKELDDCICKKEYFLYIEIEDFKNTRDAIVSAINFIKG